MTKKLIRSAHQVGKGDEPAVAAMSAFELLAHRPAPLGRFGEFRPMVLRQVGDEHLLHQRRALRLADQEDASMISDLETFSSSSLTCSLSAIGRQNRLPTSAP